MAELGSEQATGKIIIFEKLGTECIVLCLVTQSCLTLSDHMDCSLPGSSIHGDSPGKNTGWVAILSSRGSS